jgi:hypothetical protein
VGFLKDLKKLNDLGRQAEASFDPAAMTASAQGSLADLTAHMRQQVAAGQAVQATGVAGSATVVAATQTGALVNFNPVVRLELLVTVPGRPPYPAAVETVVPQIHLVRVQRGATVPVSVAAADPAQVLVDWSRA